MGGRGSGGARVRSGPGRKVGSVRWRREQRRTQRPVAAAEPSRASASVGRPDLPAAQAQFWEALAPHAIKSGKLTPATVFAFRELLDTLVLKRATLSEISRRTVASPEAQGLIAKYAALQTKVDCGMALYGLLPARGAAQPEPAEADPFAEFEQPFAVLHGGRA